MPQQPKKDIRNPVDFTNQQGVFVHPGVNPEAAAYAAGIQARRSKAPAKANIPVAGGPMPLVPVLNQPHAEGMTMEQQAERMRAMQENAQRLIGQQQITHQQESSFVERPTTGLMPEQTKTGRPQLQLLPTDTLPDEARQDPNFIDGYGSMMAGAQPGLAAKYGVVRNGRMVPAQALAGGGGPGQPRNPASKLRSESIQDLETLQKLQQQQTSQMPDATGLPKTKEEAMNLVPDGAKASPRIGNMPGDDDTTPLSQDERDKLKNFINNMDEFDMDGFRQRLMKDMLNNDEQRKIVEGRLPELQIDDLILHNRIKQRVPIIPNKFEPTFQSMTGEEDIAIKRLIMQESKSIEVSERYFIDKYALMSISIGLYAINGKPIGDHLSDSGGFDDKRFEEKFARVLRLPVHMLASLANHHFWFERRVRALFVAENVGNG